MAAHSNDCRNDRCPLHVMAGLVPAIHALLAVNKIRKTWMPAIITVLRHKFFSVVPAERAKRAKSRDPYRRARVYGSRLGATLRVAWPGRQWRGLVTQ